MPSLLSQLDSGVRLLQIDFWSHDYPIQRDFLVGLKEPGLYNKHENNPKSPKLTSWLSLIRDWSLHHPGHVPLTLILSTTQDIGKHLPSDGCISHLVETCLEVFGDAIFRPEDVVDATWPSVKDMSNKILLILSGNSMTGQSYLHNNGITPTISIMNDHTVVEVHSTEHGSLQYWTGLRQDNGDIMWRWHSHFDTGINPSLAVSSSGVVVEVHQSEKWEGLWYNVGQMTKAGYIVWPKVKDPVVRKFASGTDPFVEFLKDGTIKVTYLKGKTTYGQGGTVNIGSGTITWTQTSREKTEVRPPKNEAIFSDGLTLTITSKKTYYGMNTLFYSTSAFPEPKRIRYNQLFFVDMSPMEGLCDEEDTLFFSVSSYDELVKLEKSKGMVVRLTNFNQPGNMKVMPNFPATDFPDLPWYHTFFSKQENYVV